MLRIWTSTILLILTSNYCNAQATLNIREENSGNKRTYYFSIDGFDFCSGTLEVERDTTVRTLLVFGEEGTITDVEMYRGPFTDGFTGEELVGKGDNIKSWGDIVFDITNTKLGLYSIGYFSCNNVATIQLRIVEKK